AADATTTLAALAATLTALTTTAVTARTAVGTALTPVARTAVAPVAASRTVGRRRGPPALPTGPVEVDLSAARDLRDLHLDLVTDVEEVLDLLDPLAVAHLGDVQQAVAAGQQ